MEVKVEAPTLPTTGELPSSSDGVQQPVPTKDDGSSSGGEKLSPPAKNSDGVQQPVPTKDDGSSSGREKLSRPAKKRRGLAGMPDSDAEVIALSPPTLLATNRFVCEICNKEFQRDQNLQLHRRGHNLPWKLQQRRGKEARKLLYVCPEPSCVHHDPSRALGDLTSIKKHFCRKHGEKKWKCDKCSKRYAVQSDWKAHSRVCGTREYRCDCGTLFSRRDSFITHRAFCDALAESVGDRAGASSLFFSSPEVADRQQFTPLPGALPNLSISLLQKAAQMVAISGSSINRQEIIERTEHYEHDKAISRVGEYDRHGEIVGRASEKHDIMELITSHDPRNKRFTIICIIGGHGLGKTTLASLVYWDATVCRSFEARAWMSLSHVSDIEGLLRSAVASLTGVSCRLNDRDELEELVKEELTGKKFMLVLDDLHENNLEICKDLISLLTVGDKGSVVMVTSTSSNIVVGRLGSVHTYNLKPFMHDEFLNMATPEFAENSPLESIISRIPSEFYGFPMFAKAIHGILYSAFTQEYLDGCLSVTHYSKLTETLSKPGNLLQNLFCLSHSYLGSNQKWCHVYCSMFPKDYSYNKEKMLRLWMSQGFIIPDREKDENDASEDAFDELFHRSFFDHCPSSELEEQKYVMHEFSSHLALSASGKEFFRAHNEDLHCIPKDVRHLSIIPKQCDSEIYFSSFTQLRYLSTFLLVYNSQLDSSDCQLHVMDVQALDECFRNFRCLKTLDLSHTDIKELPESIGHMMSLCFLGLNNTNIRRLPDSVCNLSKLQTLELQNSAFLVELPNNIKDLNSLYHLDASKEHGPIYVPPGIGQLKNLRTLTSFTVGGVSWNCKLSELAHLNSLKGSLHIQSLNDVENAEDAKGACLAAKKLKKLSLEWGHSGEGVASDDKIYVAEHVLDALKPNTVLAELNIKGYYGLGFPSWMAGHTLSDLISITLDNCYNCEKLPALGALPVLRRLFIQSIRGVQRISYEFCGNGTINHNSFPKLLTLKLRDMYSLECWHDILDGDFPLLQRLSIERCPKLDSIPRFRFISDISIMSCSKLNLPGLKSLKSLKVGNLRQRNCFALSCELSSLLMLEVICCEHLCSVDGLSRLQSLKHLKFRGCARLNLDQDEPLPCTLETVDVHSNCYALSNWCPHGFEELQDASEVYRKFIKRKCEDKKEVMAR